VAERRIPVVREGGKASVPRFGLVPSKCVIAMCRDQDAAQAAMRLFDLPDGPTRAEVLARASVEIDLSGVDHV